VNIPSFDLFESSSNFPLDRFLGVLSSYYRLWDAVTIRRYAGTKFESDAIGSAQAEFDRRWGMVGSQANSTRGEWLGFVVDAAKAGNCAGSASDSAPGVSMYPHGCYYNSIDYASKRQGSKLLWGLMMPKDTIQKLERSIAQSSAPDYTGPMAVNIDLTYHAFNMEADGRIVDPTLGSDSSEWYFWQEVPEHEWRKFRHKLGDRNYEARDFAAYIDRELPKHSFDWNRLVNR
jgi:hypothetical protein